MNRQLKKKKIQKTNMYGKIFLHAHNLIDTN